MFSTHFSQQVLKLFLGNAENATLPVIVLRILTEEGRKVRNIGSVGREEVEGRDGGQGRTHSVDDPRNGGIGGVDGGGISGIEIERDSFGRPVAEIEGQRVLDDFGQGLTDGKRLIEREFETRFSVSRSAMSSSTNVIDPLIHNIHNIHDSSIAEHVLHEKFINEDRHENRIDEIRVAEEMPLIQVVNDEKFCVGKSRSTRQQRHDD
jgi:hypothetical protein